MPPVVHVAIEPRAVRNVLLSLGIGSAGGYMFYRWHMPLPWMLGSMIFVSTAALMGAPVRRYMPLRNIMIIVLGILVGSFFTAEVFKQLVAWSGAALIMLGYVAVTTVISLAVFRRIAFMDRTTAYFSSTPGGLGVMVIAGEQAGGDTQQIPIAHATRVFLVVLCVPLYFVFAGDIDPGAVRPVPGSETGYPDHRETLILLVCGLSGYLIAARIGLAFSQFLAPLILAGFAYALGWVQTPLPAPVITFAQIVIGAAIGAQFRGMRLVRMFRPAIAACIATAIMLVIAAALARITAPWVGIEEQTLLLALAPGGLAEMSLIAISMNADLAFIATMHILRITLISGAGPAFFQYVRKRSR